MRSSFLNEMRASTESAWVYFSFRQCTEVHNAIVTHLRTYVITQQEKFFCVHPLPLPPSLCSCTYIADNSAQIWRTYISK